MAGGGNRLPPHYTILEEDGMKLYELTGAFAELADRLESGEMAEEQIRDTLDSIDGAIEAKTESIIKMIRQLKAEEKALKEEKERLAKLEKSKKCQAESLREYLKYNMAKAGKKRIKTPIGSVSISDKKPTYEPVSIDLIEKNMPEAVQREPRIKKTVLNECVPKLLEKFKPEELGIEVIEGTKILIR